MSNELELGFDLDALINKGKKRPKFKFEYLKEGTQAFRILPSFDPANRRIEHVYSMHWLTGENGKTVKVLCTYYTEKYCPLCAAHKDTKEAYEHSSKADPNSQNTKRLAEAMKKLSVSRSNYYNAVNSNGEPCILELNGTVAKALEALIIDAAQKKQFDPTAVKGGVWFEFTKSGKGRDSVRVDYKRISKLVEGEMVDILDRTPFGEELVARLPQAVANIHDPKVLYIREYSSQVLADYLRGVPLPKQGNQTQSQTTDAGGEEDGGYEPGETPVQETAPTNLVGYSHFVGYSQPAEGVDQIQGTTTTPATTGQQSTTTQQGNYQNYASHAERLKALVNPGNK